MFYEIEDYTGHQVGNDEQPADWWHMQVIIDHTATAAKQPDIARDNCQDGRRAKNHKPGILVLSELQLHALTAPFMCLHHGQYFTQIS